MPKVYNDDAFESVPTFFHGLKNETREKIEKACQKLNKDLAEKSLVFFVTDGIYVRIDGDFSTKGVKI